MYRCDGTSDWMFITSGIKRGTIQVDVHCYYRLNALFKYILFYAMQMFHL